MRKIILFSIVGLSLSLLFLSVSATPPAIPTWTVRLHASHGLRAGDAVEEANHGIGQVLAVEARTEANGDPVTDVEITVDSAFRDRLHERSSFLVATPPGATRPVLSLVVFDDQSPVLPPGSVIAGAESDIELELKRQFSAMEGAVRDLSRQFDDFRQSLDRTVQSEERQRLEDSVSGLVETLRRTRDDIARAVVRELDHWRKLYDRLFPAEHEKPERVVS
jgi:ABC-type transporter Mla subunit MlaD